MATTRTKTLFYCARHRAWFEVDHSEKTCLAKGAQWAKVE